MMMKEQSANDSFKTSYVSIRVIHFTQIGKY